MEPDRASLTVEQALARDGVAVRTADPGQPDPTRPRLGDLVVDATELRPFLVDLPPGARQGMQTRRSGFDEAFAEVVANQPSIGPRAGVTEHDYETLIRAEEQLAEIDARLPAARKLVELLEETRATIHDRSHRLISAIASSVEGRASALGEPELLGRYEKTRTYRSASAAKGHRTRRRNLRNTDSEDSAPSAGEPGASSGDAAAIGQPVGSATPALTAS